MKIGCLGDIPFYVSSEAVQTVNGLEWSGSVNIATQQVHMGNARTEPTGRNPDKISLSVHLSADLGVDPWAMVLKVWEYERSFRAVSLVVGEKIYGKYRWLIESHSVSAKQYDKTGTMCACDVKISLIEYVRRD